MRSFLHKWNFILPALLTVTAVNAQTTEKQFLSGTGNDHTVSWQFYCTEGRNSGKWTTIPVPSNWELQGFGKYNYGLDKDSLRGHEKGLYKYNFRVPAGWKGRVVNIVFDGSMTDTEVKINGKSAGSTHQGSFYRFKYDIAGLLRYGKTNLLEVTVAKESANQSVNMAERHCDFWIFGGIFRPVYLEALPQEHINTVAIDAKADGQLVTAVKLANINDEAHLTAQAYSLSGEKFGDAFSVAIHKGDTAAKLETKFSSPATWSPETPNLYKLVYTLSGSANITHTVEQRFGFRTVELRERDGIYVNGVKVKFKGVCRHSFWPSSGRALSKSLSILDVQMIKDMNMNAVRMSHYPPDDHFLDVCDSLGLFVLDELTGWHHAYDTEVGSKLVKEMIEKDVNHPSIVVWDNGNEGGFNFDLDPLFDELDLQLRPLIHPWALFGHTDTQHYINYDYGDATAFHGHEIFFPTEFLHGLYDGGMGAGLHDFWELMWHEPLSAGGFLWDFSDEAVVRTDKDSILDSDGDHGPDGILGPYREKEGSYFAVKEVWSPVRIEKREITPAFDGTLTIENRWLYTNMDQCHFSWSLSKATSPYLPASAVETSGPSFAGPDLLPGQRGTLKNILPAGWKDYDVLYLTAWDPHGREIYKWSWPITRPSDLVNRIVDTAGAKTTSLGHEDSTYILEAPAKNIRVMISKRTGQIQQIINEKGGLPFNNGPVLASGNATPQQVTSHQEGNNVVLEATYDKQSLIKELKWTMYPSGWLKMDLYYYPVDPDFDMMGVSFSYPEKGKDSVKGVRWMGNGPYRVWKNRMEGVDLGVWEKAYNNTITGQAPNLYPEFKGYFSNFYWMRLQTAGQPITVVCGNEDVFLRLFTPANPFKTYNVAPPFPSGEISFMQGVPAIGTKSQKAERLGPSGAKNLFYAYYKTKEAAKQMTLYFDFSGK